MQTTESTESTKGPKKEAGTATNGAANGAKGKGVLPFPKKEDQTDQLAEEVQASDPDHYEPKEPEPKELKLAGDQYLELQNRAEEMGIEAVIDALISIVDIHQVFRTPVYFAGSSDSDDKYELAANVAEIARFLCRASSKIEINANHIVFYYRDHEKWTQGGQIVHAKGKKLDGLTRHHTGGMRAFLVINYHDWFHANPRQKVFTVYRALRERDAEGSFVAADYTGYFEEPALFGAGIYEETVKMARAFVRDAPEHVGDPHQLSLMAGVFDD